MGMLKVCIFVLFLFPKMVFSEVAEDKTLSEPMSVEVEVEEDAQVLYGKLSFVTFKGLGTLTPPLKDCSLPRLQAKVINSSNNLRISSREAKLDYDLNCLSCSNHLGGLVRFLRIKGKVSGKDLRGEHFERVWVEEPSNKDIHTSPLTKHDEFGMSISKGDKGVASIESIVKGESCEWLE